MKLLFWPEKEGKKGKLISILSSERQQAKTIAELELGSRRGQPGAGQFYGKNQTLRNGKF